MISPSRLHLQRSWFGLEAPPRRHRKKPKRRGRPAVTRTEEWQRARDRVKALRLLRERGYELDVERAA